MDITRTPFFNLNCLKFGCFQIFRNPSKYIHFQPVHHAWTLYPFETFLGIFHLVQWKSHYHYTTLTDTSGYLQSCVPNGKFPGNVLSGATSGHPVPNGKFPGKFQSGAKNKFKLFFGCPKPPKDQTRRPPGRLIGAGSGGAEPPQ